MEIGDYVIRCIECKKEWIAESYVPLIGKMVKFGATKEEAIDKLHNAIAAVTYSGKHYQED